MTSVFRELWFTAPPEGHDKKEILVRRVTNITAVVSFGLYYCNTHNIMVHSDSRLDFVRSMNGLNSYLNRYATPEARIRDFSPKF